MLWLQTSDTETDRTKPRQTCIGLTGDINEPESSPELQKLQKITLQYFNKYTLLTDLLKLRKHVKSVLSGKLFHTLITLALTKLCLETSTRNLSNKFKQSISHIDFNDHLMCFKC